jgi:hypothetical protein
VAATATGVLTACVGPGRLLKVDQRREVIAAYRKALGGASDEDQVREIATALGSLGVEVDVAAHYGFVRRWHLVTPFDNGGGAGYKVVYPPEKDVDLKAVYTGKGDAKARWTAFTTKDAHGKVDLNQALGKQKGTVAYAYAVIDSPAERLVEVRAGTPNAVKLFLNGKEVARREEYHHGMQLDQHIGRGILKAGRNTILVKVCQNEQTDSWAQEWVFQLRLCDVSGMAVPFTQPGKE